MSIDLSPYEIELLDTIDLVTKLNGAINAMAAAVNQLDNAGLIQGSWDASSGSFPSSTVANQSWVVTTAGTVDSVSFAIGDRITSLVDSASSSTYAGNWIKVPLSSAVGLVLSDIGSTVQAWSAILDATTAAFTTALATKLGYLSVTQPVDLDAMEERVAQLASATVLKGTWDASSGSFPTSTTAGETWIVSVAGTVDSVSFAVDDRILAIVDSASSSTFAANWHKLDYSDQVLTVAGKAGNVTLEQDDISGLNTSDSPQLAGINLGHASDTTLSRSAAGRLAVEGKDALLKGQSDSLTAGYSNTVYSAGTKSSGTFTPDVANGHQQSAINGGAHTLAPPSASCTLVVHYTNNGSAGTITTSGFTIVDGDSLTTTNLDEFLLYITKSGSKSLLTVKALQ
ncbi:MAG: hypothetical protein R3332_00480 [Pseudohongiellaceae bacterium]|nr:hypothetical protein [Pseudohongiellaceae bacterium]